MLTTLINGFKKGLSNNSAFYPTNNNNNKNVVNTANRTSPTRANYDSGGYVVNYADDNNFNKNVAHPRVVATPSLQQQQRSTMTTMTTTPKSTILKQPTTVFSSDRLHQQQQYQQQQPQQQPYHQQQPQQQYRQQQQPQQQYHQQQQPQQYHQQQQPQQYHQQQQPQQQYHQQQQPQQYYHQQQQRQQQQQQAKNPQQIQHSQQDKIIVPTKYKTISNDTNIITRTINNNNIISNLSSSPPPPPPLPPSTTATTMIKPTTSGKTTAISVSPPKLSTTTTKTITTTTPTTAIESQFITNFNRRCTILLNPAERKSLYSALSCYKNYNNLRTLLDRLSQILDSPIKMELVDDVRCFVDDRHLDDFDRMVPFRDVGRRFVNILARTPACDVKDKNVERLTSNQVGGRVSKTPIPNTNIGEDQVTAKLVNMSRGTPEEPLGFKLWGGAENNKAVYVCDVVKDSISDRAGLKPGDCLVDINDRSVQNATLSQVVKFVNGCLNLRLHVLRMNESSKAKTNHIGDNDKLGNSENPVYSPKYNNRSKSMLDLRDRPIYEDVNNEYATVTPRTKQRLDTVRREPNTNNLQRIPTQSNYIRTSNRKLTQNPSAYISKPFGISSWAKNNFGFLKTGSYDVTNSANEQADMKVRKVPSVKNLFRSSTMADLRRDEHFPLRKTKTVINLNDRPTIHMEDVRSGHRYPPSPVHPYSAGDGRSHSIQNVSVVGNRFVPSPLFTRRDATIPTIRTYLSLNSLERQRQHQQQQIWLNQQQNELMLTERGKLMMQQKQAENVEKHQQQRKLEKLVNGEQEIISPTFQQAHHQQTKDQNQQSIATFEPSASHSLPQQSLSQLPQQIYIQIPLDQLHLNQQPAKQQPQQTYLQQLLIPESFKQQYPIADSNKMKSPQQPQHSVQQPPSPQFPQRQQNLQQTTQKYKLHRNTSTNTSPINSPDPIMYRNPFGSGAVNEVDNPKKFYGQHNISMPNLTLNNWEHQNVYRSGIYSTDETENYFYYDDFYRTRNPQRNLSSGYMMDNYDKNANYSNLNNLKEQKYKKPKNKLTNNQKQFSSQFKSQQVISTDLDSDSSLIREPLYPSRSSKEVLFARRANSIFRQNSVKAKVPPKKPPRTIRNHTVSGVQLLSPPITFKENPLLKDNKSPTQPSKLDQRENFQLKSQSTKSSQSSAPFMLSVASGYENKDEQNDENDENISDFALEDEYDSNTYKSSNNNDVVSYDINPYKDFQDFEQDRTGDDDDEDNDVDGSVNLLVYNRLPSPVETNEKVLTVDDINDNINNYEDSVNDGKDNEVEITPNKVPSLLPRFNFSQFEAVVPRPKPATQKQTMPHLTKKQIETSKDAPKTTQKQTQTFQSRQLQQNTLQEQHLLSHSHTEQTNFQPEPDFPELSRNASISSVESEVTVVSGHYDFTNLTSSFKILDDSKIPVNSTKKQPEKSLKQDYKQETEKQRNQLLNVETSANISDESSRNSLRKIKKLSREKLIWPPPNPQNKVETSTDKTTDGDEIVLSSFKRTSDELDLKHISADQSATGANQEINTGAKHTGDANLNYNDDSMTSSNVWGSKSHSWNWSKSEGMREWKPSQPVSMNNRKKANTSTDFIESTDSGVSSMATNESLKSIQSFSNTFKKSPPNINERTFPDAKRTPNQTRTFIVPEKSADRSKSTSRNNQNNDGSIKNLLTYKPVALQRTFSERQKSLKEEQKFKETKDAKINDNLKVKLDKNFKALGLSISGGVECKAYPDIIIDKISANSAAEAEGHLKVGMKLLSVDGKSLSGATHKAAVTLIKSSFVDKSNRWMELEASG